MHTHLHAIYFNSTSHRFGPGPHKVEILFEYPKVGPNPTNEDPATWTRVRNKVVIEMAPLDLMPHTVNFFLQQVHHELWDGCSMVTNAPHIYQIGPSYSDEDKANDPQHYDHFYERGLDKVSYQEYSKEYPHAQWTVGFAGRPAGPDFYINKLDNTMIHGPGGQTNDNDLHNEADPCFGKVVEGMEALGEMNKIPTAENNNEVRYPVVIVNTRILVPKDNPAEGWRDIKVGEKLDMGGGEDGELIMPMGHQQQQQQQEQQEQ